jgi:hypothetical protein
MSEQSDREAIIREIAKKKVRYVLPNMEAVEVRRDLPYRDNLLMNIYCPAPRPGRRAPIVVIAFGYPDPLAGVRTFGPMTSWAQNSSSMRSLAQASTATFRWSWQTELTTPVFPSSPSTFLPASMD